MQDIKNNLLDFDAIRLKIASPDVIRKWSHGEVTRPETINYRTQKPEKDGLFCEKIFGPSKDWECYCGKYKRIRYKGIICEKCGVEVTRALVRRERFGHIDLATPVSHIWFLRGVPSKIGLVLDMSLQDLEKVVYFASFIITNIDEDLRMQTLAQVDDEIKSKRKQIEGDCKNQMNQLHGKSNITVEEKQAHLETLEKHKTAELKTLSEAADIAKKELKNLRTRQIISENEYYDLSLKYGHVFEAQIGAEAIQFLLNTVDVEKEIKKLEKENRIAVGQKKRKIMKRLKLLNSLMERNLKPCWMILNSVPVVPPEVRPMVALEGGRYAASDLNDLYRRVINRNNRLKRLNELSAPEVIVRNEKRMLQEAVDALIDNSARHGKTVTASTGQKRMLKSLADSLKGKQGRFRQNLLGKRVDYSGRSVIVVGPKLKLYQCGLPKQMALELFRPFVIAKLIERDLVHNVRSANRFIDSGRTEVYDILEGVIEKSHVLLNRAPTLHRLGIQSFQPVLIEGKAIQLHPLVCPAFNADFDGDQMAVHVPLTEQAKREAAEIMLSSRNLLKPATGDPIVRPEQDMVLGSYYMTFYNEKKEIDEKKLKFFSCIEEAIMAFDNKYIKIQDIIRVRLHNDYIKKCVEKPEKVVITTVGRLLFNEILPDKLRFINRILVKKDLTQLVARCFEFYGEEQTAKMLDDLKELSIKHVTDSGISFGMDDLPEVPEKVAIIKDSTSKVGEVRNQYDRGLLTDDERYTKVVEIWEKAKDAVASASKAIMATQRDNPLDIMMTSGARGSWGQTIQMMGMKGSVTNPSGKIIELPVKGSFKEGIEVLEYFISTHGARKGMADTALRTASAGYLTRRLIDVAQDATIIEMDCGEKHGFEVTKESSEEINTTLSRRILGRTLAENVKHPKTDKILYKKGHLVDNETARQINKIDLEKVRIFSALTCKSRHGLCAKCYGWDLGHNRKVDIGTAVGIIAAESIGEPGTQLTLRTLHTGGVSSESDITQGLPRVDEVFEVRAVKYKAIIAPIDGEVSIEVNEDTKETTLVISGKEDRVHSIKIPKKQIDSIQVKDKQRIKKNELLFENGEIQEFSPMPGKVNIQEIEDGDYQISVSSKKKTDKKITLNKDRILWVKNNDKVSKGDQLTEGALDLQELFEFKGLEKTQRYIIQEIQKVYSSQGQPLDDRHIEIIIRKMFSRVFVEDAGETELLPGEIVELDDFTDQNEKMQREGKREARGRYLLLGITKSSLSTSSFLSAASFQETAKILIDAAVTGKIDYLRGLKENVIIGRLVPVGTGYRGKDGKINS
ncbi:MAG: DNA-directed RNA polymerase subunit beta' [Patescibacteria group bacterium]